MRLRINIVRAPSRTLSDFKPNVPFSTLKKYGFQQMLLNVVEAPEPVLCFFCQYQGLHSVPIAGNLRMEQVNRITTELQDLNNFFTTDTRVRGCVPFELSPRVSSPLVLSEEESLPSRDQHTHNGVVVSEQTFLSKTEAFVGRINRQNHGAYNCPISW